MKGIYLLFIIMVLHGPISNAQFTLDGEFRPRTELRHGFGSLITEDADAGFGVSTRLRLNAGYTIDAYTFFCQLSRCNGLGREQAASAG